MRVAVAQFGPRVSPRFDHARVYLVATLADGTVVQQEEVWAKGLACVERVAMLAKEGVDALICGGIDDASARDLVSRGIEIYSSISGNIEDALSCFLRGELESGMMLGTGGRCCGRWRSRAGLGRAWGEEASFGREGAALGRSGVGRGSGRQMSPRGRRRDGQGGGRVAGGSGRKQGRGRGPRGPRQGGDPNASRR
jgi:predicted Fe-Mo cluster-binding NifX family protein